MIKQESRAEIMKKLAILFYQRELINLNPVLLVTPAKLEILNRQAEHLRLSQLRREPDPVWRIPVKIYADGQSPTRFEVVLEEEESK